jgi:hypothetical protein
MVYILNKILNLTAQYFNTISILYNTHYNSNCRAETDDYLLFIAYLFLHQKYKILSGS